MNKKPFWRRVNRGFVVSMALLAVVILYVLVTQLMLIPERKEIRTLTDSLLGLMEQSAKLTDDQIKTLETEGGTAQEKTRLLKELEPLFIKDSDYLADAAQMLLQQELDQTGEYAQRVSSLNDRTRKRLRILVEQDVATAGGEYRYKTSGSYTDYGTGEKKDVSDVGQSAYFTVSLKKTNDGWKIFRVSSVSWSSLQHAEGGVIYG